MGHTAWAWASQALWASTPPFRISVLYSRRRISSLQSSDIVRAPGPAFYNCKCNLKKRQIYIVSISWRNALLRLGDVRTHRSNSHPNETILSFRQHTMLRMFSPRWSRKNNNPVYAKRYAWQAFSGQIVMLDLTSPVVNEYFHLLQSKASRPVAVLRLLFCALRLFYLSERT